MFVYTVCNLIGMESDNSDFKGFEIIPPGRKYIRQYQTELATLGKKPHNSGPNWYRENPSCLYGHLCQFELPWQEREGAVSCAQDPSC